MHPILFEIGGFPVYTYGLLLAAAYLLGLQFAVVRARKRGLNPNQIMDLGHLDHRQRPRRRQADARRRRARQVRVELAGAPQPVSLRRRLLRRTDRGSRRRALVPVAPQDAHLDGDRRLRAGHRARPRRRQARLPLRRLLLRQADDDALGDHVPRQVRRTERGHDARHSAAPDAALRSGCGAADPGACCS